jgi:hypothetical protein
VSPPEIKLAVITMVYNEEVLLRQFLAYYCAQVDDVYLLDNESTDASMQEASLYPHVQVSTVHTNSQLADRIQFKAKLDKKKECIGQYDYVLLVDVDEFVVPKAGGTLKSTLSRLPKKEAFGTHGYNMFKKPWEPPYEPGTPLLNQRQWGIEEIPYYSKPIIIAPESTASYSMGFHRFTNRDNAPLKPPAATEFYLLHYTGIDEDFFVKRSLLRTHRMSQDNLKNNWGFQYYGGTEDLFRSHFRKAASDPSAIRIPCLADPATGPSKGNHPRSSGESMPDFQQRAL